MKSKEISERRYRLIQDDDGNFYVISVDEIKTFCHWVEARKGQRHYPANFKPIFVAGLKSLEFTNYKII